MQKEDLGQSVSLWMATTAATNQSPLLEDSHADVCIVGADIAGITTAYLLAKQGNSVIVLDDGVVVGGQPQVERAAPAPQRQPPAEWAAPPSAGPNQGQRKDKNKK